MTRGERRTSGQGSPAWPDTAASFLFPTQRTPQYEDNRRTTGGQGEDIGFWGCFLELSVVFLVPLLCSVAATWPCCGTAVFALDGWRFPPACHTTLARVHLLSRIGPFGAGASRAFCDLDTSRRTTRGQQEDKKRTRRGHGEDNKNTTKDKD